MINNDYSNPLSRYFNNRNADKTGKGGNAADMYKKIKERRDAINGKTPETEEETQNAAKTDKNAGAAKSDNLTAEERRQKEVQEILDRINAESGETTKTPATTTNTETAPAQGTQAGSAQNLNFDPDEYGFPSFLNDLPIFNQFKEDLVKAFNSLDGATYGSISAQFELNYSSVQMIANEMGGYDVTETSYSFKLDLNYVKAASGQGNKNASLSDLLGLDKKNPSATDMMSSLKDYFSPEKTAERIVDFSTAFFPNSSFFKEKGDTEEARGEFADMMRKAVQKGFDQAMGKLGKVPSSVQDGIDKTHELTFKGIDDFVKYGMNRNQANKTDDFYEALQAFSVSMSQSYSQKTYSVSYNQAANQTGQAEKTANPTDTQAQSNAIDAQA